MKYQIEFTQEEIATIQRLLDKAYNNAKPQYKGEYYPLINKLANARSK